MAMTQTISHATWLRSTSLRLARVHLLLLAAYAVSVGVYDSAHLMTPDIITQRSILVGIIGVANIAIWYSAHKEQAEPSYYKRLIYGQILLGVLLAAGSIYTDRGVASRDVALFAVPIISSAALINHSALFGTAALSGVAYFLVSMRYYFMHPNEMLHVELYGMLTFHILLFFIAASLLWIVARARK